jgi:hypothetical protein
MGFFERLVQSLVISELDLYPIVLSQDRLRGILAFPEIGAGGLLKEFSGA